MKIYILVLSMSLFRFTAFAYNSSKCQAYKKQYLIGQRTMISSTSYISSSGPCAAIAYHSKENKKVFYVNNKLELQLDIAKGEGAYLSELNSIYSCSDKSQVNKILMQNYQSIYGSKKPSNAIDLVLKTQKCKYL